MDLQGGVGDSPVQIDATRLPAFDPERVCLRLALVKNQLPADIPRRFQWVNIHCLKGAGKKWGGQSRRQAYLWEHGLTVGRQPPAAEGVTILSLLCMRESGPRFVRTKLHNILMPNGQNLWPTANEIIGNSLEKALQLLSSLWLSQRRCLIATLSP